MSDGDPAFNFHPTLNQEVVPLNTMYNDYPPDHRCVAVRWFHDELIKGPFLRAYIHGGSASMMMVTKVEAINNLAEYYSKYCKTQLDLFLPFDPYQLDITLCEANRFWTRLLTAEQLESGMRVSVFKRHHRTLLFFGGKGQWIWYPVKEYQNIIVDKELISICSQPSHSWKFLKELKGD